jgi:hypothetical protein
MVKAERDNDDETDISPVSPSVMRNDTELSVLKMPDASMTAFFIDAGNIMFLSLQILLSWLNGTKFD